MSEEAGRHEILSSDLKTKFTYSSEGTAPGDRRFSQQQSYASSHEDLMKMLSSLPDQRNLGRLRVPGMKTELQFHILTTFKPKIVYELQSTFSFGSFNSEA